MRPLTACSSARIVLCGLSRAGCAGRALDQQTGEMGVRDQEHAGSLFAVEVPYAGLPEPLFGY